MRIRLKINPDKLKSFFQRLPRRLAERAFLTFLALTLLSFALGGLVFYNYAVLAEDKKIDILETPPILQEELFGEVLEARQAKEAKFEQADDREYPDLFWAEEVFTDDIEQDEELTEEGN